MLYTLHECKIQNRLTSKSSFSNARKCLLCSRQASQNRDAVTSLQHEQPGTSEWSVLGLKEIRKTWEQILLCGISIVCPLWMKPTSPHPGLPITANPSLANPEKVRPLGLKLEKPSGLCKSRWEALHLLVFL